MRRPLFALFALVASFVPALNGPAPVSAATADGGGSGYWMLSADGRVFPFGDVDDHGDQVSVRSGDESVDLEGSPSGRGYWILSKAGLIDAYGDARGRVVIDQPPRLDMDEEATGLAATPSGDGLWLFTSKGRVLSFGSADSFGDMVGTPLNDPVLDASPTPSGRGYYMVASDGGIFTFGDASFHGSMGGQRLNAPVQSLVPDQDGSGYWLVAADGGIFAFDAPFKGSMGGTPLNKPVVGMVPHGDGYLMAGADGGIFNFSSHPYSGSLGDRPPRHPVVAVAAFESTVLGPAGSTSGQTEETPPVSTAPGSPSTTTSSTTPTTSTTAPIEDPPSDAGPEDDPLPEGMPDDAPDMVIPCETSGRSAKVWNDPAESTWAVHNPCDRGLVVAWNWLDSGASKAQGVVIGPGVSFHEPGGTGGDFWNAYLTNSLEKCWPEGGLPMRLQGSDEWVVPYCD